MVLKCVGVVWCVLGWFGGCFHGPYITCRIQAVSPLFFFFFFFFFFVVVVVVVVVIDRQYRSVYASPFSRDQTIPHLDLSHLTL